MMPQVGDHVYTISDYNRISFGTVIAEEERVGWRWYRVSWVNEEPSNITAKRSMNPNTGWFRSDTLAFFDPKQMMSEINNLFLAA
jgi:hypothetical protein